MHAAALISGTCKLQNIKPLQIYGTLKIVASHYVQWESKVRCGCALLNMSKAFDMIDHGHLFDLLLQHKLPYLVLCFLHDSVEIPSLSPGLLPPQRMLYWLKCQCSVV